MEKDGTESVSKGNPKRDEKGRFLPGSPGGPGRKAKEPITLAKIEESLQDDLKSTDPKIRQGAVKLLLTLRKAGLSDESEKITLLDPRLQRALGVAMSGILEDPDISEILDE